MRNDTFKCLSYLRFLPFTLNLAMICQNYLEIEEVSVVCFFFSGGRKVFFPRLTKQLVSSELLLQPLIQKNPEKRTCW